MKSTNSPSWEIHKWSYIIFYAPMAESLNGFKLNKLHPNDRLCQWKSSTLLIPESESVAVRIMWRVTNIQTVYSRQYTRLVHLLIVHYATTGNLSILSLIHTMQFYLYVVGKQFSHRKTSTFF